MSKTAFIWDLDGTLLDSYGIIVSSLYKTLLEFNISLEKEEIHKELITSSLGVYLSKIEREKGISSDVIKKRFTQINDGQKLNIKAMKNAAEILDFLKNRDIPNYVFTHKGKTTEAVLKNIGLYDFFGEIITGNDGFPKKPDPSALNYLIQKHELEKSRTYYVGDRTLDIACAKNAGIRSILYLPEGSFAIPNGEETYVVKDLLEISQIIPEDRDENNE